MALFKSAFRETFGERGRVDTKSTGKEAVIRAREKSAITELTLAPSYREPFRVIAICGGEGVGKTTLAHMVYKEERVQALFDLKIWAHVPDYFSSAAYFKSRSSNILCLPRRVRESIGVPIIKVLLSILLSRRDGMSLGTELRQTLHNKKFLIVLDGLSYLNPEQLDCIYRLFAGVRHGSKLIVTTSDHNLSGRNEIFSLGYLSDDDCWSLFEHHALGDGGFNAHPQLQSMGRRFVVKCRGCPLAAVVLGGLLRTNQDPNQWNAILHAKEWETPESKSGIVPALMVSFRFLPSHLKHCFVYCSLFPRSHLFEKDEVVRLWMEEGILGELGEEVGSIYFSELLSRSFFQPSFRNEKLFEMHDLVFDLSKRSRVRELLHILLERHSLDTKSHGLSLSTDAFRKLMGNFVYLGELSSNFCKIGGGLQVPICPMKRLTCLDLSQTQIKYLPESVGDLIQLQTLDLSQSHSLVSLPLGFANLINLCFLDISNTFKVRKISPQIDRCESARSFCKFTVKNDKGLGIKELGSFPWLEGDLLISGLHNVKDEEDAKKANLKDKEGLDCIAMEWSSRFDGSRNGIVEMKVLNSLLPHAKLGKLAVTCYGGPAFPPWIGDRSFKNMSSIEIYDCKAVRSLPSLGRLPLLRDLSIRGLKCVITVGDEFYGDADGYEYGYPFPCLENLRFEDMPEWLDWLPPSDPAKDVSFHSLRVLQIVNCPKLVGQLPEGMMISPLERLEFSGCASLAKFPEGEISTPALRQLIIHGCSQLECVFEKLPRFSPSLLVVDLNGYTNLTSLPTYLDGLKFLVQLSIANCPCLKSFPDFPQDSVSFPKLEELAIKNCDNLESLPNHMINLTSLRSLSISNCRRLNSLPEGGFLPCNLISLTILNCTNIHEPISEWGLDKLSCLSVLFIGAVGPPDMATFPDYLCDLPPGITKLSVKQMKKLEYLGDGLLDLPSLRELHITDCPMLKYFPRDGLPPTLHAISIRGCPFLQQRCARDREYLRFLAYIPIVETY